MPSIFQRFAFPLVAVLAIALHIALVFAEAPPRIVFSEKPIPNLYFDFQISQTWAVTDALGRDGQSWAYDPDLLAGSPTGTFVDTNSRAWELWTYGLWKMGLPRGTAFNLFVLLAHLLVPWVFFLSARLFGLGRWPALAAAALGSALWFFDGHIHWSWWSGTVAYPVASYLALLAFALLHRYLSSPGWRLAIAISLVLTVALLVHPYVAVALLVPVGAACFPAVGKLPVPQRIALVGAAIVAIAANAYWIYLGIRFSHLENGSSALGLGTLSHLVTDLFGFTSDTRVSGGVGMRSGFRVIVFGGAAITLVLWRRDRDGRFWAFAAGIGALLAVAYLGGYLPGLSRIQPYRQITPALFFAVIPAAELLDELARRRAFSGLPRIAYAAIAILVLGAIPRLARDVVYFVPQLVPEPKNLPEETPHISDVIGFGNIGYPRHRDYRHGEVPKYVEKVATWLAQWKPEQGRVLVEYAPLAEHLAWRTRAAILGGCLFRDLAHGKANFFVRYPTEDPSADALRRYLETYAVGWIILINNPGLAETDYRPRLRGQADLLQTVAKVRPFELLRSKLPVSYFEEGSGTIRTALNRIEVTGSPPGADLVLRYHFLKNLACNKGCKLERSKVAGDPIGFIRVRAPHPADFTIINRY